MASRTCKSGIDCKPKQLIKVSIVDDEEWDRMRESQILAKSGKFHPDSLYASAEQAVREIPGGQSQVVLMDVRMPRIVARHFLAWNQ